MTNNLLNKINEMTSYKLTENGALSQSSSLNHNVDLFAMVGAYRDRNGNDIISLFSKAFDENPTLALKCMFYARDILEGLGERRIFRIIAKYMAKYHKEEMKRNMIYIKDFGRFDDYFAFINTDLEEYAFCILHHQLNEDLENYQNGKPVSLLAKWLKSESTSSQDSRIIARKTMMYFNMNPKTYRKTLSTLREYIDVTERKMSSKDWNDINFESVPSVCMNKNNKAFKRNTNGAFEAYIDDVKNGNKKINANTLYPYDIVNKCCWDYRYEVCTCDEVYEQQWKNLPNFVDGENNYLVMADVSGSMLGHPLDVSISLAIYFAERNKGIFHNTFMSFTDVPRLHKISENVSLAQKAYEVTRQVGFDTNLELAFEVVLNAAIKGHCTKEELPKSIIVISDMEINEFGSRDNNLSFTDEMERRFKEAGYEMPVIIYWNVNARQNTFLGDINNKHVRFISGSASANFKYLCKTIGDSAYDLMYQTLMSPRYEMIK